MESTFVINDFDESQQTATLQSRAKYISYVRTTIFEADAFCCDVFVFDSADKMVMQRSNLQFRRVDNASLERILGRDNDAPLAAPKIYKSLKQYSSPSKLPPQKVDTGRGKGANIIPLLNSIAFETGIETAEMTDDAMLSELGVHSIMAMQVVATVRNTTGIDVPSSAIFQHPTTGGLRKALASIEVSAGEAIEPSVEYIVIAARPAASQDGLAPSTSVRDSILRAISAESDNEMQDLKDDALLAELRM